MQDPLACASCLYSYQPVLQTYRVGGSACAPGAGDGRAHPPAGSPTFSNPVRWVNPSAFESVCGGGAALRLRNYPPYWRTTAGLAVGLWHRSLGQGRHSDRRPRLGELASHLAEGHIHFQPRHGSRDEYGLRPKVVFSSRDLGWRCAYPRLRWNEAFGQEACVPCSVHAWDCLSLPDMPTSGGLCGHGTQRVPCLPPKNPVEQTRSIFMGKIANSFRRASVNGCSLWGWADCRGSIQLPFRTPGGSCFGSNILGGGRRFPSLDSGLAWWYYRDDLRSGVLSAIGAGEIAKV